MRIGSEDDHSLGSKETGARAVLPSATQTVAGASWRRSCVRAMGTAPRTGTVGTEVLLFLFRGLTTIPEE